MVDSDSTVSSTKSRPSASTVTCGMQTVSENRQKLRKEINDDHKAMVLLDVFPATKHRSNDSRLCVSWSIFLTSGRSFGSFTFFVL